MKGHLPPDDKSGPKFGGLDGGLNLVVSVLVMGAIGYMIDKWLRTLPLFMLLLGVAGFAAWFYQAWKASRKGD